jgi:hypothetical protein
LYFFADSLFGFDEFCGAWGYYLSSSVNNNLPRIARARGWRLYTAEGRRLVDLWQCGGKAALGHKGRNNALRAFKNATERGLLAPFPSVYAERLLGSLRELFPGWELRMYRDRLSCAAALAARGLCAAKLPRWRPFFDAASPFALALSFEGEPPTVFSPVLPFPLSPEILALGKNAAGDFPASDLVSPAILAGTLRALDDMLASPERAACGAGLADAAASSWRRRGIYLFFMGDEAAYEAQYRRFLEAGYLLPPDTSDPAILPGELSAGEEAKLARLLGEEGAMDACNNGLRR